MVVHQETTREERCPYNFKGGITMTEVAALKDKINVMQNQMNHLLSNIIRLDTRITNEIQIAKITFHDIEVLKAAHQPEFEHFRHVHKEGD